MKTKAKTEKLSIKWNEQSWVPKICRKKVTLALPVKMKTQCKNTVSPMSRALTRGFTLVELLVVIAIIAILAGLLMPAISNAMKKAKITTARTEMQGIIAAVNQYYAEYSRYPTSPNAAQALTAGSPDFTFGTGYTGGAKVKAKDGQSVTETVNTGLAHEFSNAEVMSILLNLETYVESPYGTVTDTANKNFARNPRKNVFLNAKQVSTLGMPGIGPDLVYRDPWGNPYIITMDMNYDDKCRDAFYRTVSVSQDSGNKGFFGLVSTNATDFELNAPVMIWSFGPDGKIDSTAKANAGLNKDNILSWGGK